jgi:hypothetical protein
LITLFASLYPLNIGAGNNVASALGLVLILVANQAEVLARSIALALILLPCRFLPARKREGSFSF